jgi:hypothetical protein
MRGAPRQSTVFLPYLGHFSVRMGRDEIVGDPNQVVFMAEAKTTG